MVQKYGEPDFIVVEAARSLAEGKKARLERDARNRLNQQERQDARENLSENKQSTSRQALLRYRLWKETDGVCPFCLKAMPRASLFTEADIEHLVPRSRVDCNEFYNLTVAHIACNREIKKHKTPYEAFSHLPEWEHIESNARKCFKGRKLELFLSPDAETKIEEKADLQHTAYIARAVRHVTLIQLSWLGENGRDPVIEKQSPSLRFQVTNGHLTSRLRQEWGLNQILHPLPSREKWDAMTPEQQQQSREETAKKNRGDLRHHALDAMVIASTLPWLAHRTHGAKDEDGNFGWWTQDGKKRSKAANPIDLNYLKAKQIIENAEVRPHASRSKHQQAYDTTFYARKRPNCYVVRKELGKLRPANFVDIYPEEFGAYCQAAWHLFEEETPDVLKILKNSKGYLPDVFIQKLCFSHFQNWRASGMPEFRWPTLVKIPIRSVRAICITDDKAVAPSSPGTRAFVDRTSFKEVRMCVSVDGKEFVPVFVPFWRQDLPFHNYKGEINPKPLRVIRKGINVEIVKPFCGGRPPGIYRVIGTRQTQLQVIPYYLANNPESCLAAGLPANAIQARWLDFFQALGYELPHPPSPQPRTSRPGEA